MWLEGKPGTAILLPGVPYEMRMLLENEVIPRIEGRGKREEGRAELIRSLTLRTTGIGESALAEKIGEIEDRIAPVTLAYLPSVEGVDLRLTAWGMEAARATEVLELAAVQLRLAAAHHWYGDDDTDLAAMVLDRLRGRGERLAVAESCTGGMLGERITAVPGSSSVFVGGVISYADRVKTVELGVPESALLTHGAVSEPVVEAMVRGVVKKFGVEAGMAVTGVAGPEGGTPEKPVGTVWLAAAHGSEIKTVKRRFMGGRQEVRARSVQAALDLLRALIPS